MYSQPLIDVKYQERARGGPSGRDRRPDVPDHQGVAAVRLAAAAGGGGGRVVRPAQQLQVRQRLRKQ